MIDFHTHILQGIDDGFNTVSTSVTALEYMYSHGIDVVVATPHYYRNKQNIDEFLTKRQNAKQQILEEVQNKNIPDIILGAEVFYFPGISRKEGLEKLCIENTKYMLLEMPFAKWDSFIINELKSLIAARNIIPIIAHIDRYFKFKNKIDIILPLQIPVQINADSLMKIGLGSFLLKYIKKGYVQIVASDCHNLNSRPPNLHLGMERVNRGLGENAVRKLDSITRLLLNQK